MFFEAIMVKIHALLAAFLVSAAPAAHADPTLDPQRPLCHLRDSRITESSGVAVGPDVLWTHNDSGDTARFFALDRHCNTLATYDVTDETATDWEDMARGAGYLWLGDIGDNAGTRSSIAVVRVPDLAVSKGSHHLTGAVFRFAYEDGPHDAETLLVHPRTGQLYVVTKSYYGLAGVYAAPLHPLEGKVNTLTKVVSVTTRLTGTSGGPIGPPGELSVTAGDINAAATRVVLRTYTDAYEWTVAGGDVAKALSGTPTVTALPRTDQGEAIAYDTDGRSWITTSEGKGAPVDRIAR